MDLPERNNLAGSLWLIADLSLNIWSLSIVKALGLDYPPAQLVFLRAVVGFVVISPLILRHRRAFRHVEQVWLHVLRVVLAAFTMTASYYAIARLPLAVFTAINFMRPLIVMVMAVFVLREIIGPRRWLAAGVALIGVMIAVNPSVVPWSPAVAALLAVVFTGSAAVIVTRKLRAAPTIVFMAFTTAGLTLLTAGIALPNWHPIAEGELLPLLAIGVFSQAAQFCFLRAHFWGEAGVLAVLGYLSLVFSTLIGFFVFDETPGFEVFLGAGLIIGASLFVHIRTRRAA